MNLSKAEEQAIELNRGLLFGALDTQWPPIYDKQQNVGSMRRQPVKLA